MREPELLTSSRERRSAHAERRGEGVRIQCLARVMDAMRHQG